MDRDITYGANAPSRLTVIDNRERVAKERAAIEEIVDWLQSVIEENGMHINYLQDRLEPITSQQVEDDRDVPNIPRSGSSNIYNRLFDLYVSAMHNSSRINRIKESLEV